MQDESLNRLPDEYKKQLDQFIETNYDRLKRYARHIAHDDYEAEVILHETFKQLYDGRRILSFERNPLTYFQFLLRSVVFQLLSNRQDSFETGYQTKIVKVIRKKGEKVKVARKACKTVIREPISEINEVSTPPFDINDLDKSTRYIAYCNLKLTCTPRQLWILEHLESNHTPDEMYALLIEQGVVIGRRGFRVQVTRMLRLVEQAMEKALLRDGL